MPALSIVSVVGCRPDFIKLAPLVAEMKRHRDIRAQLVYTGPHQDLSGEVSQQDIGLPEADIFLNAGSGSHARQTAQIMQMLEGVLFDLSPDLVFVMGERNSTVAASMTAIKLGFPVAHVEAGLRSFDREMPEEINRIMTDSVADLLFASERSAVNNLRREGTPRDRIIHVGSILIDTLLMLSETIARSDVLERLSLVHRNYGLVALERPSSLEDESNVARICNALEELQRHFRCVFPVRTTMEACLQRTGMSKRLAALANVQLVEAPGFVDFIKLQRESLFAVTDSGGIQEESTALGVPCLTLHRKTERPVTVTQGTNRLVGTDPQRIVSEALKIARGSIVRGRVPDKWDGQSAKRIIDAVLKRQEHIKQLYRMVRRRGICSDISSAA
jgi:UDP-N-acetylglucosamine 2-epimerase (non-hydrolysing)